VAADEEQFFCEGEEGGLGAVGEGDGGFGEVNYFVDGEGLAGDEVGVVGLYFQGVVAADPEVGAVFAGLVGEHIALVYGEVLLAYYLCV
jgi:hypothetical protein